MFQLKWNESHLASTLVPICQWTHGFSLWSLDIVGNHLIVGDAHQSTTMLSWNGRKLDYIAKDWSPLHTMNVTADDTYIIQSEVRPKAFLSKLADDSQGQRKLGVSNSQRKYA